MTYSAGSLSSSSRGHSVTPRRKSKLLRAPAHLALRHSTRLESSGLPRIRQEGEITRRTRTPKLTRVDAPAVSGSRTPSRPLFSPSSRPVTLGGSAGASRTRPLTPTPPRPRPAPARLPGPKNATRSSSSSHLPTSQPQHRTRRQQAARSCRTHTSPPTRPSRPRPRLRPRASSRPRRARLARRWRT